MNTQIAVRFTALTIGLTLAMGGCGGNSSSRDAGTSAGAGTATAATPGSETARRNACDFVNRAEVEAIIGKAVTLLHDIQSDTETACELSDAANSKVTLVVVTVVWTGGKAEADAEKAAVAMGRSLMNEKDVDIEALTGSGAAAGLADAAYYSDVMPSWLLKGDVLIKVIAPTSPGEQTKRIYLSVAKMALARL